METIREITRGKMKALGRRKYYEIGTKMFEAWYKANTGNKTYQITIRKYKNFKSWTEDCVAFDLNGKTYTEDGIDHFNGHFSGYTDRSALYGVYLREII